MESDRGVQLSHVGRLLLDEAQCRFPICVRPYAAIARRLGLTEKRVIRLLGEYRARGVVRRIGPRYDARACGLDTVLVALAVPPGGVCEAVSRINAMHGVTHNYLRRHPLNIWFTLASKGRGQRKRVLRALTRALRPTRMLELPATQTFKLRVMFDLGLRGEKGRGKPEEKGTAPRKSKGSARVSTHTPALPMDLPLSRRPFPRGAVGAVRGLLASGRMRRFGAVLDGEPLGFRYRALVAWSVPPGRVGEAGRTLASFDAVSHCYARPARRAWPYALYTMIHEKDRRRGVQLVRRMSRAAGDSGHMVLETVRVLKRAPLAPGDFLSFPP